MKRGMASSSWEVADYASATGNRPVQKFYVALQEGDKTDFITVVQALREYGGTLRMPHPKPLGGRLFELRGGRVRVFYVFTGSQKALLLHGYLKQGQKAPKRELEVARKRVKEVLG